MISIGVDLGKAGAIARLYYPQEEPSHWVLDTHKIPLFPGKKRQYDPKEIMLLIRRVCVIADPEYVRVTIEQPQTIPRESAKGSLSLGQCFGLIEMAVVSCGVPYEIVHPRTWQKEIFHGIAKDNPKNMALVAFKRLYPNIDPMTLDTEKKRREGRIDASLIAEYGRRKQG